MICTETGCTATAERRGFCSPHYRIFLIDGSRTNVQNQGRVCAVEDCDRGAVRKRWCERHYRRAIRNGDPTVTPPRPKKDPSALSMTYKAVHTRVTRLRGRAADQPCVDCGSPARQWSYTGADPNEVTGTTSPRKGYEVKVTWSLDPAFYAARCVPCHQEHDAAVRI